MFSIVAAAALAASGTPAAVAEDPDFRCLAVTAVVLDAAPKDTIEDAAGVTGLTAIFMYYLGRVDLRYPQLDFVAAFGELDKSPDFMNGFAEDAERCGAEAQKRAEALQAMGRTLQAQPPPLPGKPG